MNSDSTVSELLARPSTTFRQGLIERYYVQKNYNLVFADNEGKCSFKILSPFSNFSF